MIRWRELFRRVHPFHVVGWDQTATADDPDAAVDTSERSESVPGFTWNEAGVVAGLGLSPRGLTLEDTHLYVADRRGNYVFAIDGTDPSAPTVVAEYRSRPLSNPNKLDSNGDTLVVSNRTGGLVTFDITTPGDLSVLGSTCFEGFSSTYGIRLHDGHAYVADRGGRVGVVDLETPSDPCLVGSVLDETRLIGATGIDIVDEYLVVAVGGSPNHTHNDRVVAIDVANPARPSIVDVISDENLDQADAITVTTCGDYALVGGWDMARLTVLDIADPSDCRIVAVNQTPAMQECFHIDIVTVDETDYAFCSAKGVAASQQDGGLVVYDITDPPNPKQLASIVLTNGANMHGCQACEHTVFGLATDEQVLTAVTWDQQ